MFGRRESFRDFIRSEGESLRELARNQQQEFLRVQGEREEKYRLLVEETREYNREILLRNEKVYTSAIAELERMGEETRRNTEQIKANTQAVLSVLDRLDGLGGAPA